MRFYNNRIPRILVVLFFALVIGYGYFEGRGLIVGPTIDAPTQPMYVSERLIKIEGTAQHVISLLMNGSPIPTTESGAFSEVYALSPGYNRVTLDAKDRYGKTTSRIIEVFLNATSTPHTSTSTELTASSSPSRTTTASTTEPNTQATSSKVAPRHR